MSRDVHPLAPVRQNPPFSRKFQQFRFNVVVKFQPFCNGKICCSQATPLQNFLYLHIKFMDLKSSSLLDNNICEYI